MKQKTILAILLFITFSFSGNAQQGKKTAVKGKTTTPIISKFTGQVVSWTNNEDYMFDGFYLQTTTNKYFVKFPSNKASIITTAIKTSTIATVEGVEKTTKSGIKEIHLISITTDGINIYDSRDVLKMKKESTAIVSGAAKIVEIQKDNEKNIKGYILDNKTILRIPPHVAAQLKTDATIGSSISYTGITSEKHNGEVASIAFTIIKCKTIMLNGKQYILIK